MGDPIDVLVQPFNHKWSKIVGFRKYPFKLWGLIFIILPLSGLFFIYKMMEIGERASHILECGVYTRGRYLKSSEIGNYENEEIEYKHLISFTDMKGNAHTTSFTSTKDRIMPNVELIYNRYTPEDTFILASMGLLFKKRFLKLILPNRIPSNIAER